MVASQSDLAAELGGEIATMGAGAVFAEWGAVRSYDHRGQVFSWRAPGGLACERAALDIEAKDSPAIESLSSRFHVRPDEFLRRWTATETLAKVLDLPILELLRRSGLSPEAPLHWTYREGVWLRRVEMATHWATVAFVATGVRSKV
jgi:hypothetical protein